MGQFAIQFGSFTRDQRDDQSVDRPSHPASRVWPTSKLCKGRPAAPAFGGCGFDRACCPATFSHHGIDDNVPLMQETTALQTSQRPLTQDIGHSQRDRLVIDETWASTNMARTHGRCQRGERLRAAVPHGHWNTTTCVAALTARGIIAPWVLDGPIKRDAFETYVEKVLVPELPQSASVIMNNLSSHKGPSIRQMLEATGATLLYLPPHNPDLNPIENAFAKLKANLRKAAERTVNGL